MMTRRHLSSLFTLLCIASSALVAACSRDTPTELRVPAIEFISPTDGAALSWNDDTGLTTAGFQIDIAGVLSGFDSLEGAALSLAIDGQTSAARATLRGDAFAFEQVTLAGGTRKIAVFAHTARQNASAEITVTVPEGEPTGEAAVEILTPESGKLFAWSEDSDVEAARFQFNLSGKLHNMPIGEAAPTVSVKIDGALIETAVNVTPAEDSASSHFSAHGVTIDPGVHQIVVEAAQGERRAFAQIYIALSPASDSVEDAYAIAIDSPQNGAVLDWSQDAQSEVSGFQLDVEGTLRGFGAEASVTISRNGLAIEAVPFRNSEASYSFPAISLPAGQQVLIVTASETIEGQQVQREALAVIAVPEQRPIEGLAVEISSPTNNASLALSEDADPALDGFQIDIAGTLLTTVAAMNETSLSLQIDGVNHEGVIATIEAASQDGEPLPPEDTEIVRAFRFANVTLPSGIHEIVVLASQKETQALDQITIAIPASISGLPAGEITSPVNGTALSLTDGRARVDVTGVYTNAQTLTLLINGQPSGTVEAAMPQGGTFTFPGVELVEGMHALQVQVSGPSYQAFTETVIVHVAAFDIRVYWPTDIAAIYANDSGEAAIELVGQLLGCDGCLGAPSITAHIENSDGIQSEHSLSLDANRAFRQALTFSAAHGSATLVVRARQSMQSADTGDTSPTFEVEKRVELTILAADQKPAFSLTMTSPSDGSVLTWRDNTSFTQEDFQISVEANVAGMNIGDADFALYVDGVQQKSGTSQDCALTTDDQSVIAITCHRVALHSGTRLISLTATAKSNGRQVESHALVTVPELSGESASERVIIAFPSEGTALLWSSDRAFTSGFQTDISGRFTGFGSDVALTLAIDGENSDAVAAIGANVFTFRDVTLPSGSRTLKVTARQGSGESELVASDEITVVVPDPQSIELTSERIEGDESSRGTRLNGTLVNFSGEAMFTLDVYVDGVRAMARTDALTAEQIAAGTFDLTLPDSELNLSSEGDCHYLTFALAGTEGQNESTAVTNLVVGDCETTPKVILITSPHNGSELRIANSNSVLLAVTGVLLGYSDEELQTLQLTLGAHECQIVSGTSAFNCTADFAVGPNQITVSDAANGIHSASIDIQVTNSTGCPVTLALDNLPINEAGVIEFNRQTSGISLFHDQGATKASYLFFGSVPSECAGGSVTVLKKLSGGSYETVETSPHIQADGSFAYRATLNDAETDAELAFSVSMEHFAAASGAQLTYTADFTVPLLIAGEGDTFQIGAMNALSLRHESDLRDGGLKARVSTSDNGDVLGTFDLTFTAQGLSQDSMTADTLTIAYDGSSTPLLSESIHQTAAGDSEQFTRAISLPEGYWTISITLADAVGNKSTASFPIHVDLGCNVTLTSPLPNSAIAIDANMQLTLGGTSTCASVAYGLRVGAGSEPTSCDPSAETGDFSCAVALPEGLGMHEAVEVALIAPNGAEQTVRVFQHTLSQGIQHTAPVLKDNGLVVVSPHNRHCATIDETTSACATEGYAADLTPEDDAQGTFQLTLTASAPTAGNDGESGEASDESQEGEGTPVLPSSGDYDQFNCRYLLGDKVLDMTNCEISAEGVINQRVSLPQGTVDEFRVEITASHSESGLSATLQLNFGVTIASQRPAKPVFQLPEGGAVVDCEEESGASVTCVRDRHQGVLEVWLDETAPGITRKRGFATGTAIAINHPNNNTEAFDDTTFNEGTLMHWFSAIPMEIDSLETQTLNVTPMNYIHLGAQDEDAHGNYSEIAIVKSVDMFWDSFKRTFSEENNESQLDIQKISGMYFGQMVAVGDYNGDGLDDLAVTAGAIENDGFLFIYYGQQNTGLNALNRQIIRIEKYKAINAITAVDIDHDGYDDLVSIHYDSETWTYPTQIHFGTATGVSPEQEFIDIQYTFTYGENISKTGFLNIETIGDINGDGYSDLAFSESLEGISLEHIPNPTANVFIVPTGTELMNNLQKQNITLSEISHYKIIGETSDALGLGIFSASWNILTVPETNVSGLIIGAPGNKTAYYFSHTTLETSCLVNTGCQAASAANHTFILTEEHAYQEFGKAIAILDQNGDGISDVFFGLPSLLNGDENPQNYILNALGTNNDDSLSFNLLTQFNNETMTKGYFGKNLLPANLLGDGYEALIVGGYSTVDDRLHIFWNSAANGLSRDYGSIIEGPATFGYSLETGDFNGDGRLDLVVGAPSYAGCTDKDSSGDTNGEFYVYY